MKAILVESNLEEVGFGVRVKAVYMKRKKTAFTLIELLVVIVIIGILATITTATFNNSVDKSHQAKSYALQSQINTLIQGDCLLKGYECGKNIVPNWAFSEGDTGEWSLSTGYFINKYKLHHPIRVLGSGSPDFTRVPTGAMTNGGIYRVDVVARDADNGGRASGSVGFSYVGSGIGAHAKFFGEGNAHICDVFQYIASPNGIRLHVQAGSGVYFDEISIRPVIGYSDIENNNDCAIDGFEQS